MGARDGSGAGDFEPAELELRGVEPADEDEARALILEGLVEHWGELDPTANPDLESICQSYAEGVFLVGRLRGRLIATGGLVPDPSGAARVVRMSVARAVRRTGVGRAVLRRLIAEARRRGYRRLVLETTAGWRDAEAFYRAAGLRDLGIDRGDRHFDLALDGDVP